MRQAGTCCVASQIRSALVDVTADDERRDPDSELEQVTTPDPNEHEASSHDADSNPYFDEIPEGNPERRVRIVGRLHKVSNTQSGRLPSSNQNHVVDSQTEPDLLETDRMIAKHHEDRWTKFVSNRNPPVSTKQKEYRKQGRSVKRWEDDLNSNLQPDRTNRDSNDLTSDVICLTTAEDIPKWDATESDFMNNRLEQPARPTTSTNTTTTQPTTHKQTTYITNAHDKNEDDTKDLPQNQDHYSKEARPKDSNQKFARHTHPGRNAVPS